MNPQEARHAENVERIARLEERVNRVLEDVAELKLEVHPISDAFQQARGVKATVMVIGMLAIAAFGAGAREIASWLFSAFGKH